MFREMRRIKQQITYDECIEILKNEPRGILSVLGDDDYPYGFPMDFVYDEKDSNIYFHCAKEGHKIDSVKKHDKVSFCVYDKGVKRENHWSLDIKSVIVFGRIEIIENEKEAYDKIKLLGKKYIPTFEELEKEMSHAPKALCLKLTIEHMTGKKVNEA